MSRLDDIQKRLDERMAEIDRRIGGVTGEDRSTLNTSPNTVRASDGSSRSGNGRVADSATLRKMLSALNPGYVDWIQGGRARGGVNYGLVPQPYDFSYLSQFRSSVGIRDALPARFDLRQENALTPIRDQGNFGTCWAHAAMASIESSILKNGGAQCDFSENNLANLHGYDHDAYHNGGTSIMASSYFLRWDGPVSESDDPYGRPGESVRLPAAKHLQSVRWIPPMADDLDGSLYKEAIFKSGAVWMGYYDEHNAPNFYNPSTAAYYVPLTNPPPKGNHAVAIVGWDDRYSASNFATRPPGDGAWIVRNSWGVGFGDKGYFYVSYYDATFCRQFPGFQFSGVEEVDNYQDILQYDELGMVLAFGDGESASGANVFTATRNMAIGAVGFYALTPGTSYRVRIYSGGISQGPTGNVLAEQSGIAEWAGYLTVRIGTAPRIRSGERFSVVVEFNSPGTAQPLALEVAVPGITGRANAVEGQSYVCVKDFGWVDLTLLDKSANFCLKVYVKNEGDEEAERSWKRFCPQCGKYTYTEKSTGAARCQYCGGWLESKSRGGDDGCSDGVDRSTKRFCKKCGKYTWTETPTGADRCQYCGEWL